MKFKKIKDLVDLQIDHAIILKNQIIYAGLRQLSTNKLIEQLGRNQNYTYVLH